ncbi:SDR family oxidoreductase [Shewanella maritima]|uniref:SDR family oxidoreductase n=1 Tax=Shewanella maritima TaxID=2520507 RepID=UPI003736DE9F
MKNIVITGANRGIGLALVKQFIDKNYRVFAVCRQSSLALAQLDVEVIDGIDVVNEDDLIRLQQRLMDVDIDSLICNAGILRDEQLGNLNLATIREQFEVNAIAPLRIVELLETHLVNNAKIAMITSRMGSIADNSSGGRYGYRMSKAALNAASMSISHDLAYKGVAIGIYHPGYVQTDMVGNRGDISAEEAAKRLTGLIENLSLANSGVFMHSNGQVLPW